MSDHTDDCNKTDSSYGDDCQYNKDSCSKKRKCPLSNLNKWAIAFAFGLLFALISSRALYCLTDSLFCPLGLHTYCLSNYGPTMFGFIVHIIVFILLVRLILF